MTPENQQTPNNYFLTWRYILFWISSLLSNIGSWMQEVVQPWLVLSLSGSPMWVGLTSFSTNIPGLLFTLPGGILADRFDRKKITIFFQSIQFVFVVTMLVLLVTGLLKVWMIIVVSFVVGLTDALCNPSLQTIIPSLVERRNIPRAVSLGATQYNLSRILGPVLAGIVIARFGAVACFGANVVSYLPFFVAIWVIYPRKFEKGYKEPVQAKPSHQFKEIRELLQSSDVARPLVTVFGAGFFCGPLVTFCSVLVKDVFRSGEGDYGWAMAAFGVGALIGASSSFLQLPASFGRYRLAATAAVVQGFLIVAIAFNHSFPILCALLVVAGAAQITVNISINSFLQEHSDDHLRGRVISLYQLAMYTGVAIGALLTGFMVAKFNISDALLLNGSLAIVFQGWFLWRTLHKRAGSKC